MAWQTTAALLINLFLAGAAPVVGLVSFSGALGGLIIGAAIILAAGPAAYALLVAFFIIASAATKLGYRHKQKLGVAQEAGGRRGALHAAANCVVALGCAFAWRFSGGAYLWELAYAGAFAAALSDTVSTELGQLYGRTPILITSFRRVPVGTEGAVSLEGTLSGLVSGAVLGFLAAGIGFLAGFRDAAAVTVAAFVAMLAESYFARLVNTKGLGNEVANLFNTAVGAAAAAGIGMLLVGT